MKRMLMALVLIFLMAGVLAAESGETFYTDDFYIFLGLVLLVLIIVGIFVWLWIRGPVNKWKKN